LSHDDVARHTWYLRGIIAGVTSVLQTDRILQSVVMRTMVTIGCNTTVEMWLLKQSYIVTTILHTSQFSNGYKNC